jgi:sarcosine oxidase
MEDRVAHTDVTIVGSGVFGAWTALLARRSGFSVRLVDQYGPANSLSSSTGESRITRMAYAADEIYTRLAAKSLILWKELFDLAGTRSCFQQTGALWMAAAEEPGLAETQAVFDRVGIIYQRLGSDELRKRYPHLSVPEGTEAIFEPGSGALLAERSVASVMRGALTEGVVFEKAVVQPVETGRGHLEFVQTTDGRRLYSDLIVFACGSWLPKMFPRELELIRPTRQELFFFEAPQSDPDFDPARMPVWIDQTDERLPYGFPNIEGAGIKVAFHRNGPNFDPDTGDRSVTEAQITEASNYLRSRFPSLPIVLKTTRVCHYENTPDADLLADRHPAFDNVWVIGGGSGHGFKHAPGIAQSLLQAVGGGQQEEPRFTLASKKAGIK